MTPGVPATIEGIRQRAYEIFMARGGTPNELDDWPRAQQGLKQERAAGETVTTQGGRIWSCLGIVGAALLVMLFNGCASVATSAASDPSQYNSDTGHPAVEAPHWGWLFR